MQRSLMRVDAQLGMSGSRWNLSYVPNMVNIDPFTEQGTLRCMPLLEKDESSPVNEPTIIVSTPNGSVYFFSKTSGRIWKYNGGGWSSITSNPNGAHTGATFHFGRIYFFTDTTVGYFMWDNEGSGNYSYAVGLRNDGQPNHTHAIRGMLYFTNGPFIGRIDKQGNVTNNILELPTGQYAVALTSIGYRIKWASISGDSGANMYIGSANSNVKFLSNGKRGDLFIENGSQMWFRRRIPNQETYPAPYNQTVWRGMPLFGWDERIYTYHKQEEGDYFVLCQPFTVSQGEGTRINSMSNIQTNNLTGSFDGWSSSYDEPDELDAGGDVFFVSWTNHNGESGVDKLNNKKYAKGFVEYPVIDSANNKTGVEFKDLRLYTDIIPEGTSANLYTNVNNEGFKIKKAYPYLHETTFKDYVTENKDKLLKFFEIRGGFKYKPKGRQVYVQPKIELIPSENKMETPVVRSFIELST